MPSPGRTAAGLVQGYSRIPKRLVLGYIVDWIVIIGTAAVGGALSFIDGNRHPFNLYDPNISLPIRPDTVSVAVVTIISLIVPGVIIFVLSLILIPGQYPPSTKSRSASWRLKLWELNAGWMGLGVALAGAYTLTTFLKDLYGKPRPDLIARCDPDLSQVARYTIGGLSAELNLAPIIVDHRICRQTDRSILDNGFASFPSGHSSFAFAGLLYLSLYLAAKLQIAIPYLGPLPPHDSTSYHPRSRSAAPPLLGLVIVSAPIVTALFVTASRWYDHRHHGFDIIVGSLIGIFFAWLGFRWYHMPISQGGGWAWAPRTQPLWIGVGRRGGWTTHPSSSSSPLPHRITDEEQGLNPTHDSPIKHQTPLRNGRHNRTSTQEQNLLRKTNNTDSMDGTTSSITRDGQESFELNSYVRDPNSHLHSNTDGRAYTYVDGEGEAGRAPTTGQSHKTLIDRNGGLEH